MVPQGGWENLGRVARWKTGGDLAWNRMHTNLTLNWIRNNKNWTSMHKINRGVHLLAIPFGESPIDMSSILARHQLELNKAVTSDFAVALSVRGLTRRATCTFNTWKHSKEGWNKKDNTSMDGKAWIIPVPAEDEMHLGRKEEEKITQTETGDVATAGTKKVPQQRTKEAAENHLLETISKSAEPAKQNETNKATSKEVKEQKDKVKGRLEEGEVEQSRKESKLEDKHSAKEEEDEELKEYGKQAGDRDDNTSKPRAEWNKIQECMENASLQEIYLTGMKVAEAGKARNIGKREWSEGKHYQLDTRCGLGEIYLTDMKAAEAGKARNIGKGEWLEEKDYQLDTRCGLGAEGEGWKNESSRKELQLEEIKENTGEDTSNKAEHEESQREICGQKDERKNEATETTGTEIGREPGRRKEAAAVATHCRRENNDSKLIREQTDKKTRKKDGKESDKDQKRNENERRTGENDAEGGLWHC